MALPSLPSQGQDPWYATRTAWDNVVKAELEGRLSEDQLNATIGAVSRTITATAENFPGLDDTGATDASAMLASIASSAPNGSTIKLPGTYRIASMLTLPARGITYDCTGGLFILQASNTNIMCASDFEAQVAVSALDRAASLTMDDNVATTTAKLTMGAAVPWKRGDIVKVISDDPIPAAHITSDTMKPRVGEFGVVYEVDGNDVYLSGPLIEGAHMATSIRAARLIPDTVSVISPTATVDDATIASKQSVNFWRFQNLVNPRVDAVNVRQQTGMSLSFKSCYGYTITNPSSLYNMDNSSIGVLGYTVHDSSCAHGVQFGGAMSGGRHAFTDGTGLVEAGSSDTSSYGATINQKIIGSTAIYMKHAGFDTHHMSLGTEFIDCTVYAIPGAPAFLLRGRNHRVINPKVFGGREVLYVYTQETGSWSQGESYGHELVNPMAIGTERLVTDTRRTNANHPNHNVRDTRPTHVVGANLTDCKRLFVLVNSTVHVSGQVDARFAPNADGGYLNQLTNAALIGFASIRLDLSAVVTVGTNRRVLECLDSSTAHSVVRLSQLRILASSEYATATSSGPFAISEHVAEYSIDDLVFENYPWVTTTPITASDTNLAAQSVKYRVLPGGAPTKSSAYLVKQNASIATTLRNLFRSTDAVLTLALSVTDSTSRTLIALPPGKFPGQRLTVYLSAANGGATATVLNGAPGNILLKGAADRVLSPGGTLDAVFTGTTWLES